MNKLEQHLKSAGIINYHQEYLWLKNEAPSSNKLEEWVQQRAAGMPLAYILQSMDFFVSFHLDEEFKETVKSRHRDTFDYNNFSEGEKMRIDLALVFTWRAIAKMKNSANTNLMVLDEIFDSSLDGQGTDDFFKIVNKMGKENIFIISHKGDILFDKFTNIIKLEKEHNFTRLQNV